MTRPAWPGGRRAAGAATLAALSLLPGSLAADDAVGPRPPVRWHLFASASRISNSGSGDLLANHYRVFDQDAERVHFDLASLSLDRTGVPLGFRLDLVAGHSVPIFAPYGAWEPEKVDAKQAFVTWTPRVGGPGLQVGRFVTSAGYEVIEDWDATNVNLSRSLLFGYAVPFTHTGVRLSVPLRGGGSLLAGVNRGWDRWRDDNGSPSLELAANLVPSGTSTLMLDFHAGPEGAGEAARWRFLVDVVATLRPAERWTLALNADWGVQRQPSLPAASWGGAAAYAVWSPGPAHSVALRLEEFHDPDGYRTGTRQTLRDVDLTLGLRPRPWLLLRLDGRLDWSSAACFGPGAAAGGHQTQATLGLAASFRF